MRTANYMKAGNARFIHSDNSVGVVGEFPALTEAVREGDLAKVSFLCAQLFALNSDVETRPDTNRSPRRTPIT